MVVAIAGPTSAIGVADNAMPAAWIHIHQIFDEVGAGNVIWVWCGNANTFKNPNSFTHAYAWEYYPGDDPRFLDWNVYGRFDKLLVKLTQLLAQRLRNTSSQLVKVLQEQKTPAPPVITDRIERLLVAGTGLDYAQASAIVEETLASPPYAVHAEDLRLAFPSEEIDFRQIAAPAGLAALAWG